MQYTIELRRMLNEVPVQEGVRQFLFQVWADVLATTAVRYGAQGEQTKAMKRAAADLIWSASAKVTREERAEVIRRLPPLLKTLREGMASAGMDAPNAGRAHPAAQQLAGRGLHRQGRGDPRRPPARADGAAGDAGGTAARRRATSRSTSRWCSTCPGHQSAELEVVLDGGSMPTPAMLAWARELQVGSWYMLDYRGRNEAVQLAWHGHAQAAVAVRHAAGPLRAVPAAAAGVATCRPACCCRRRTRR
ncbi:MAG: DUF1631 domain-containing protein [Comamonadaceae bacterium]|nr:DUF1631 domain-containing protein [Comamonadaceae bacterium]